MATSLPRVRSITHTASLETSCVYVNLGYALEKNIGAGGSHQPRRVISQNCLDS